MSDSIYFPHQLSKNIKLLHKVAIIDANKQVLLLKRSSQAKSRPSCWDLPGGNSEWPVNIGHPSRDLHKLDIAREVWEEIGLRVSPEDFSLDKLVYFSTYFDPKKQIYTVICGWALTSFIDSLQHVSISDEHSAYQWIKQKQLQDFDFGAEKGQFIKDMINNAFKEFLSKSSF